MFRKLTFFGISLALILFSFSVTAQEVTEISTNNSASTTIVLGISEVSLLKTSVELINLQLNQQDAGLSVQTSTSDSTARLLISSVISTSLPRTLTAKITAGTPPVGSHLELSVLQPNANFAGSTGTFTISTALDGTDRPIITDIESCYSGTGASDGYPLRFLYALDANQSNYGSLRATTGTQIVVTFTLTAAQ